MSAFELPGLPTWVFVIVPRSAEGKEFVTVVDEGREGGRKIPGGGASKDRIIAHSGLIEIQEETGLTIDPPTQKVLEVHKRDDGTNISHHWMAMVSQPPVSCADLVEERARLAFLTGADREATEARIKAILLGWPLKPQKGEIKEARWCTAEEILSAVAERKFLHYRGSALKWYLSGRSEQALDDILRDRRILSWFIEDGCLVLCYDKNCEVCDRPVPAPAEMPEEETMAKYFPLEKNGTQPSLPNLSRGRSSGISPEEQKVSGEVEVMFITTDGVEDYLCLRRDMFYGERYARAVGPCVVSRDASAISVADLAKMFGVTAERQVTLTRKGGATVLVAVSARKMPEDDPRSPVFLSFSLNGPPPEELVMRLSQAASMMEALKRFSAVHPLWMHYGWINNRWSAALRREVMKARWERREMEVSA